MAGELTVATFADNQMVVTRVSALVPEDELSQTLAALSDPTRRSILEQLSLGPASVKELSTPYDMSQAAVSKHIKVLEAAGLVAQDPGNRLGRRRLALTPFTKAAEWMNAYSRVWTARLEQFEGHRAKPSGSKTARVS